MGVSRLKKKIELNYRRGGTAHDCSGCNHFVSDRKVLDLFGLEPDGHPRCGIIGVQPGRMYRINPKSICDRHDNSNALKRLRGW
jgi:hypothetical protein